MEQAGGGPPSLTTAPPEALRPSPEALPPSPPAPQVRRTRSWHVTTRSAAVAAAGSGAGAVEPPAASCGGGATGSTSPIPGVLSRRISRCGILRVKLGLQLSRPVMSIVSTSPTGPGRRHQHRARPHNGTSISCLIDVAIHTPPRLARRRKPPPSLVTVNTTCSYMGVAILHYIR